MNHIMYGRITVAFTVRLQHQNAEAGGTNPIVHLQALVRQRHVLVEAEPGVAWNPLPALDCTRRVFVYASLHICTSHLSLCFSSLSVSLCALRVFRGHPPPPCACCMQLLRLAYAESKVPTSPAA